MFGRVFRDDVDVCEQLNGLEDGRLSSTSDGDVLLRRPELASEGELGTKGSKRTGGGDDSGEELSGMATSMRRRCVCRSVEGGRMKSSAGGDDSGEVVNCAGIATVGPMRGVL